MPKSSRSNNKRVSNADFEIERSAGTYSGHAQGFGVNTRAATDSRRQSYAGWRRGFRVRNPDQRAILRAERVIAFIEKLRVPSGFGKGKNFKLRAWQKEFIFDVYANCYPDGSRRTRRAILSVARKNGKTALIAALVLVHLIGPEATLNDEILSAANSKKQAATVFKYLRQIIALSPALTEKLEITASTKTIAYHGLGTVYTALAADAENAHGENPAVIIYDELAQSKNRDFFDALDTSQDAQLEPLFFTISTQNNDPQHPLSVMIDDGLSGEDKSIICHLYEVPEDIEDIFNEEHFIHANPAYGDFKSVVGMISDAEKAKRLPSFEARFRNLQLNQRVSLMSTLFTRTVWMKCSKPDVKFTRGERVLLALDLATTTDLCALSMLSEDGMKLRTFFWKPEDLLDDHGRRDRQEYALWHQKGWLEPCPGKTIDPQSVAIKIGEIMGEFDVIGLAYDRWRIGTLKKALIDEDIDAGEEENSDLRLYPWGQGYASMAPAIDAFENAVINEHIQHDNNPLLNWNIANAVVVQDPAGNRKLDKEKSRLRIDGAQSATMVVGLHHQFKTDAPEEGSYMDDADMEIL